MGIFGPPTLVYRIEVHARLLILRKNSPLHGLILVCTFIDFETIFPPARLFRTARLFGTLEYTEKISLLWWGGGKICQRPLVDFLPLPTLWRPGCLQHYFY